VGDDSSESDGDADAARRHRDKCLFSCGVTRCWCWLEKSPEGAISASDGLPTNLGQSASW